eukprot:COSAG02_NODE_17954_length_969_cov_0.890805_1_plen_83_part_01
MRERRRAGWHRGTAERGGCTAAQSSISSCARFSEHFFAAHRKELAALAALYCRELAVDGAIGETYGKVGWGRASEHARGREVE